MIQKAIRIKCDVCGKHTDWEKEPETNEPMAPLPGWMHLSLQDTRDLSRLRGKDYCSRECVLKDTNTLIDKLERIDEQED